MSSADSDPIVYLSRLPDRRRNAILAYANTIQPGDLEALGGFLKRQSPERTDEQIAQLCGVSRATVTRWSTYQALKETIAARAKSSSPPSNQRRRDSDHWTLDSPDRDASHVSEQSHGGFVDLPKLFQALPTRQRNAVFAFIHAIRTEEPVALAIFLKGLRSEAGNEQIACICDVSLTTLVRSKEYRAFKPRLTDCARIQRQPTQWRRTPAGRWPLDPPDRV